MKHEFSNGCGFFRWFCMTIPFLLSHDMGLKVSVRVTQTAMQAGCFNRLLSEEVTEVQISLLIVLSWQIVPLPCIVKGFLRHGRAGLSPSSAHTWPSGLHAWEGRPGCMVVLINVSIRRKRLPLGEAEDVQSGISVQHNLVLLLSNWGHLPPVFHYPL